MNYTNIYLKYDKLYNESVDRNTCKSILRSSLWDEESKTSKGRSFIMKLYIYIYIMHTITFVISVFGEN